jgi:hypothetical protein
MDVIQEILSQYGVESVEEWEINAPHEVEVEACDPLTIEKIASDRVSVGHYFTQNGDLMSDPEVVFKIDDGEWSPVSFTSHPHPPRHEHDESGLGMSSFLETWEKNIRNMGYLREAGHSETGAGNSGGAEV